MKINYILENTTHFKVTTEIRFAMRNNHWRRFYQLLTNPHQKKRAMQHKELALNIEKTLDATYPDWRLVFLKPKKKNPASR